MLKVIGGETRGETLHLIKDWANPEHVGHGPAQQMQFTFDPVGRRRSADWWFILAVLGEAVKVTA